ncbi:Glucose-methanol-choline oxidoreductase [Devosia sp. LC5]|uniref:GMC family oxidoreductase n=1 Tax=Devosia sp. LC5 TaxID=1502724 RepID=UPI0004E435CA|nr:GMC family oxidoreductase N-terminal domain-containing protein [Devosia sp. LC5]KFC66217.1 Glucose-methanol-choline oxidoreductase [Devosia sp. LC5]
MADRTDEFVFDYLVVGAGTAGGLLASRLAADGRFTVALVEAGRRSANPLLSLPLGVGQVWNDPRYNWSYRSEPEPFLDGRELYLPRGKVLGGSSAINAMNHVRGNRHDYESWAALGLNGWSYDEILPYFLRSEDWRGSPSAMRGAGGPIAVSEPAQKDPIIDAVFASLRAAGHRHNRDYNGVVQDGFGRAQFNMSQGRRQDTGSRFVFPAARRQSLKVFGNTVADRIQFSEQGRAIAVDGVRDGLPLTIRARREIILSAGAYGSPAILLRSGIGPAEELAEHNIPLVANQPNVGRNLFDHPRIALEYVRRRPSQIHRTLRYDRLVMALARGTLFGTGPATQPLAAGHLFAHTRPGLPAPNVQALFRLFNPRLRPRWPFSPRGEADTFGFVICLLHPQSRGYVRLRARAPHAPPGIRHNFFASAEDLQQLVEGGRMLRAATTSPLLDDHAAGELYPGDDCQSDDEWADFVRSTADTIFHPGGTCAMGTVTDADLSVRGVSGLRIADASVMPLPVSGNTNAAVMMVAERASDLILRSSHC